MVAAILASPSPSDGVHSVRSDGSGSSSDSPSWGAQPGSMAALSLGVCGNTPEGASCSWSAPTTSFTRARDCGVNTPESGRESGHDAEDDLLPAPGRVFVIEIPASQPDPGGPGPANRGVFSNVFEPPSPHFPFLGLSFLGRSHLLCPLVHGGAHDAFSFRICLLHLLWHCRAWPIGTLSSSVPLTPKAGSGFARLLLPVCD